MEAFANLQTDVVLHDPKLGDEFLLKVRVVKMEQDLIHVTAFGDTEEKVIEDQTRVRLICLGVKSV